MAWRNSARDLCQLLYLYMFFSMGSFINQQIRETLLKKAESDYKKFSASLIPGVNNMLGIRLPFLRDMAKALVCGDWRAYLEEAECDYFEEVMLQGMVVGFASRKTTERTCASAAEPDLNETLLMVEQFVPKISNWSLCDSFCAGLKFVKRNKAVVWNFLQKYLVSDKEFELRFGVVLLLDYYIDSDYIDRVLDVLGNVRHDSRYVKMAVAWALSVCVVKQREKTLTFLQERRIDKETLQMTKQKVSDSFRVSEADKAFVRGLA